jgi:hypothetical protein
VDGRLEGIEPRDRSSGKSLVGEDTDCLNVTWCRQDSSEVKNATQQAVFLTIVVTRAAVLDLKAGSRDSRQRTSTEFCPMMVVKRRGAQVNHEIGGQCGDRTQVVAQENPHRRIISFLRAFGRKGDWLGRTPCLYRFFPNALA